MVSTVRWAADAYVVYLVCDDAGLLPRLRLPALGIRRHLISVDSAGATPIPLADAGGAADEEGTTYCKHPRHQTHPNTAWAVLGSVGVGLLFTLPWSLRHKFPTPSLVSVPLWIPYVPTQGETYAVAYGVDAVPGAAVELVSTRVCRELY